MYFRFLSVLAVLALPVIAAARDSLRVCADPNNMPFSNQRGEGFENKLADLIAAKMGAKVEYTWWSERKSYVRNTLDQGRCDLLLGVPSSLDSVTASRPYYRSTYVFVSRRAADLHIASLADPRLGNWRIGIQVVGDDYAPPAYALAHRGITKNVTGFNLFGEYGEQNPSSKIIDAVEDGSIDVAIVWGPSAGYFAKIANVPLDIAPVSPPMFFAVPFTYDISLGVRKGDEAFKQRLDGILESEAGAIHRLLSDYGVPQLP